MPRRRVSATATRDRIVAALAADAPDVDDLAERLTPAQVHAAWSGGVWAEVASAIARLVDEVLEGPLRHRTASTMALGRTGSLFSAFVVRCGCCDGEALAALLWILPTAYAPGCLTEHADPRQLTGTLLAGAMQEVLVILSRRGMARRLRMSTNSQASPACLRTTMDDHAEALSNPLLAQCMVEYWAVLLARYFAGAVSPQVPECGLLVLAHEVPRVVFDAVPTVIADLVESLSILTGLTYLPSSVSYIARSLTLLSNLAATAPGHVRCMSDAPAVVTAAASAIASTGAQFEEHDASARLALSLYAVMAASGSPSAVAMRAHAPSLELLARWAAAEVVGSNFEVSPTALCAHLVVDAYRERGGGMPTALASARATWDEAAAKPPSSAISGAGRLLAILAAGRSPTGGIPWAPATFPPSAVPPFLSSVRCWSCGSQGSNLTGGAREPPRLRRCSGCSVARVCSASCHKALWREGHRRACAAWNSWAIAAGLGRTFPGHVAMYVAQSHGLGGDWRAWTWPPGLAAGVEAVGLTLSDVIVVADPGLGALVVVPAAEYRWQRDAVPAVYREKPLEKHGGRVLRVILRAHPPTLRSFGPVSLRLI